MLAMEDALNDMEVLGKMRDEELKKLVDLASDRETAEFILRKIRALERRMSPGQGEARVLTYAKYGSAVEAIVEFLKKRDEPVPLEELKAALIAEGFHAGGNREEAEFKIDQSFRSFKTGLGKRAKNVKVKILNERAGLGHWDDALFR